MKFTLLDCENKKIRASCHITVASSIHLDYRHILSEIEIHKYDSFKVESAKNSFLLGRYSAKTAYMELNPNKKLKDIDVQNGVFGQPFFTNDSEFELSIAHSDRIGAAIVFDKAYPLGIDIETRNASEDRSDIFSLVTKFDEIGNIEGVLSRSDQILRLIVAWCMKEALTKILKTGLTIPIDLLCLKDFIKSGNIWRNNSLFQCKFENFPQYKGIAKITDSYVVAIAYPRQLTVNKFE